MIKHHNCRDLLCVTPHYEEPIETGYTDKDIPIECPECSVKVEGVDVMQAHILDTHPNYTPVEAVNYARIWADTAYEEAENEIRNQEPELSCDRDPY